ncbi:ABC transporter ATP-binding protein [Candidatus Sumerlaeota bacterium]|nr:ABC transporter ATP-binding protein [Candidatus Sumerlaeota bacterium]
MTQPIVEIESLSFRIGRKPILRDVSMSVGEGEYWCVVGPNGAGKTTLLKCLDRIYSGTEGAIRIAGRPLREYSQKNLAKLMSYVPQADAATSPFTVHEFVMMGRYPHLSPFSSIRKTDEEAVRRALELTGSIEFVDRRLDTLSGGERQKVHIAAALAQEPRILLLDEPTTFLDYRHQADILALLKRINRESGATVVAVTHDVNCALLSSDRILALKRGSVVYSGEASGVLDEGVLARIYDAAFEFIRHEATGRTIVAPQGVAV